jgi:flavin reductase (DIM6/NTAB) family NADH-FMN oxidoreductase RutF
MTSKLKGFIETNPFTLTENVFDMLQDEWMLITAGEENDYNTMTAAWGGFGILWRKPVATIYIRPQRYTYQFTEKYNTFSLCFFGHDKFREALSFCGAKSGRDFDKVKETGLTPITTPQGNLAFSQARLIIGCTKLYADDIKPQLMLNPTIDSSIYPMKDYHRFYIAEITEVYEQDTRR